MNLDDEFFDIFKNKIRRMIISEIIENQGATFTELKNKTRVNPGTLTFHLTKLETFIRKGPNGKYYARPNIQSLYDKLLELKENNISFGDPKRNEKVLTLYPIFKWIYQNKTKSLALFLCIIMFQLITYIFLNISPFLLVFISPNNIIEIFLNYILRIICIYLPIELFFYIKTRQRFSLSLLISTVFSTMLFSYFPPYTYKLDLYSPALFIIILYLIILQIFFLLFMSTAIQINKQAKKSESYLLLIILMEILNLISFNVIILI